MPLQFQENVLPAESFEAGDKILRGFRLLILRQKTRQFPLASARQENKVALIVEPFPFEAGPAGLTRLLVGAG